MFGGFEIAPRAALAAPTEPFVIHAQSLVIAVVSILSVLGGAWMVASFFAFSNLRSFRHQLILGLAISDCVMAFNFLLSSSMNVSGRWIGAPEQAGFCSFNGYMTQVFVIQTDYWVFVIAIYTYFVLTDQKKCSSWIQSHPLLPWALPWVLSVAWASVGLGVTGYGDIGAWCWFTSDQVRLLVNFVPRWAIIVIMFLMYARLYFLLFKAHRRLVSLDHSSSGNPSGSESRQLESGGISQQGGPTAVAPRHTRRLKRLARLMLLYPLAYAVVWSLPTGIRIYQTATGQSAPWQLQTVDKACIVLQGLVDAIIYGATESSMSSWRNLFFPRRFPTVDGIAPAGVSYGDLSDKASRSSRWISTARAAPLSSVPSMRDVNMAEAGSMTSLADSTHTRSAEVTPVGSNGDIELETIKSPRRGSASGLGITKTVEIEVTSSAGSGKSPEPRRPLNAYFPEKATGTFLNL